MATAAAQTNGVPASSAGSNSQTIGANTQASQPHLSQMSAHSTQQPSQHHHATAHNPATPTPRPRDARTLELLLTAQGVTSYETRVPLLLLDFAYRHTAAVLSDALHLSADPYTSHAGARPSAAAGAVASAPPGADASVSANAVQVAIASRLSSQFRGGGGATGGGAASKEWLLELARDRNRVALPRVAPAEWGLRLPSERFVLSGVSWGLRDTWAGGEEGDDDDDESMELGDTMEGVEMAPEDVGGDGVEGGTMDDVFGPEDEDMEAE